jgi:uncharacterized protein (DUF433 family)
LVEREPNESQCHSCPSLRTDECGGLRIRGSRVTFDLVIEQYENGMTPEGIVRAYDTLHVADVDAAITYYLGHRDELRTYLKRREEQAEALRWKIEDEHPRISRQELLARHSVRSRGTL